jgi:ATP-dependent DNA helicase Rep
MRLNPQQEAARTHVETPLLVLAGAGSGKTGVITHKIAHLIRDRDYLPEKIAAITFTNKAAREMRSRVSKLLKGTDIRGLQVCTFHALGLRMLHQECQRIGLRPGFSIFDSQDSGSLLRDLLPRGSAPELIDNTQWQISRWKGATIRPEQAAEQARSGGEQQVAEVYGQYQDKLRHFNAVDFDDLIMQPVLLMEDIESVRLTWQQRLRYLLVDEYQDTNGSQYRMLKLLLGERGALTAVGDDDQSIYGWRGAQPENLDLLRTDYPDLEIIKLEQNYRSSRTILKAANHLIAHNPHAIEKQLWSELGEGETIRVTPCDDAQQEAERVVTGIIHRRFVAKCEHGDFAILYRSNHQARLFEQTLRSHRIPYVLSGGQSFFERSEIKDLMSYLRLIANPNDDGAFLRVINIPRREIGAGSVEAIADFAASNNLPMSAALERHGCLARLGRRPALKAGQFEQWLGRLRQQAADGDPQAVLERVIDDTDYFNWLKRQSKDAAHADRRIRAVDDLRQWLRRLMNSDDAPTSLTELIQQLTLQNNDDDEDEQRDAVRLMTLHAAKGLEFPHVYMVGVEEGTLPHRSSLEEGTLEEERRLMYVGITRAQRSLALTYAKRRHRYGETQACAPSRFLEELPEDLIQWEGKDQQLDETESKQRARAHLDQLRAMLSD